MPTYAYEAMNTSGQEVKEEIEATSSEEAIAKIPGFNAERARKLLETLAANAPV